MRHRNIFVSRWMALAWAVGIVWFALDISTPDAPDVDTNQQQATDATDSPVSNDQVNELERSIANL